MTSAPSRSIFDPRRLAFLAVALALAVAPLVPVMPVYWVTLLDNIGLATLVVIGLVLLTGVGGMTSFGQAAFCGFGAYATAVLTTRYGVSPWATLFVALAITLVAASLLGFITVRLSGHYLPLGTIAWGMAIYFLFGRLDALGRHDGITAIPPLSIGGWELSDSRSIFYVIWGFVLIALIATSNLLDSRMGRAIRALRGATGAAEAFGVDTARVKLLVFVYAALLASVSGWLYAHMQRAVNPTPFGINASIEYLFMAVAGGTGHVAAAIVGSALVTFLKEILQRVLPALLGHRANYETIVFGLVLVFLLQKARGGLWPQIEKLLPAPRAPALEDAKPPPQRSLPARGAEVLVLERVRKQFHGLVAVNDVSLRVRAGEIVSLIGPNGAGKSTTFNLATGMLRLTSGAVSFLGEDVSGEAPRRIAARGLARTFQHVKLLPDMSVLDNVALGAHLRGRAGVLRACLRLDRAEEARLLRDAARQIERVGLGEHMLKPAGSLALGQLRILEIARALCLDPVLLLLDEPAAGLRHMEKRELAILLDKLRVERMSVLLVEHDMGFVMSLADHVVVLDFGTLIAEGAPDEVRRHPAVIEAYLGASA